MPASVADSNTVRRLARPDPGRPRHERRGRPTGRSRPPSRGARRTSAEQRRRRACVSVLWPRSGARVGGRRRGREPGRHLGRRRDLRVQEQVHGRPPRPGAGHVLQEATSSRCSGTFAARRALRPAREQPGPQGPAVRPALSAGRGAWRDRRDRATGAARPGLARRARRHGLHDGRRALRVRSASGPTTDGAVTFSCRAARTPEALPQLMLNEIDYDQLGADTAASSSSTTPVAGPPISVGSRSCFVDGDDGQGVPTRAAERHAARRRRTSSSRSTRRTAPDGVALYDVVDQEAARLAVLRGRDRRAATIGSRHVRPRRGNARCRRPSPTRTRSPARSRGSRTGATPTTRRPTGRFTTDGHARCNAELSPG